MVASNTEYTVCSTIIDDVSLLSYIINDLQPKHFFMEVCRKIYAEAVDKYIARQGFSEATCMDKFRDYESEIVEIISCTPVSANTLKSIALIIVDYSERRETIAKIDELKAIILSGEDYSMEELTSLRRNSQIKERSNKDIIDSMEAAISSPKKDIGTGIPTLDRMLSLDKGNLIVIAARPSMGKTALIAGIIWHLLRQQEGSIFFSLEMPAESIMMRMLANGSGEWLSNIKRGDVKNPYNYNRVKEDLFSDLFILIDQAVDENQTYSYAAKKILERPGIRNVFIDHLTYIKDSGGHTNNHLRISVITKVLKRLAKDLQIKVWLLSQLNRDVEKRPNKRPMLSDLRESGAIEEDADVVVGVYRESYYKARENDSKEQITNPAELIVLKNRDGEVGTAHTHFIGPIVKFTDDVGMESSDNLEQGGSNEDIIELPVIL